MAYYAIGDLQGCYDELMALLDQLRYDPEVDHLWFAGDLVSRGPGSLPCLRFVRSLGASAVTVLGNHDLSLLAAAQGFTRLNPTLKPVLQAPDGPELLDWLRHQPLLHHDPQLDYVLVHAGLPPQWDLTEARDHAREFTSALRGPDYREVLKAMYGDHPDAWSPALEGAGRLRYIVNALTRMRYCTSEGRLDFGHKGPPGTQGASLYPWFEVPGRRSAHLRILFGHWSQVGEVKVPGVYPLDTGCVWGGALTALRLDAPGANPVIHRHPCPRHASP